MTDEELELSRAAAILGRKGGRSRSEAKKAAVRENGKLGGRPMGAKDKKPRKRKARETIVTTLLMVLLLASCNLDTVKEDWDYHTDCNYSPTDIYDLLGWMGSNIDYMKDTEQYNTFDYWATPGETLASMKGDCDDKAILFMYLAREKLGYSPKLIIIHDPEGTKCHAGVLLEEYSDTRFLCSSQTKTWRITETYNYGETMWIAQYTHGQPR